MKSNNQKLVDLEREAQQHGSAITEINGRKICCRVKYQRRNGVKRPSAYFELDGKRAKHADVVAAIAA